VRIAKNEVPVKVSAPGAMARQIKDFGEVSGNEKMDAVCLTVAAGSDFKPLLQGLEDDLCQCPHWGYVVKGKATVSYGDGSDEIVTTGDILYFPPGHTLMVEEDSEFILFSPQQAHTEVLNHINKKLGA
jgi:hypothetical protein